MTKTSSIKEFYHFIEMKYNKNSNHEDNQYKLKKHILVKPLSFVLNMYEKNAFGVVNYFQPLKLKGTATFYT
jgi:hypothetical protein